MELQSDPWQTGFRAWVARRPFAKLRDAFGVACGARGMSGPQMRDGLELVVRVPGLRWVLRNRLYETSVLTDLALVGCAPYERALVYVLIGECLLLCGERQEALQEAHSVLFKATPINDNKPVGCADESGDAERNLARVLNAVALLFWHLGEVAEASHAARKAMVVASEANTDHELGIAENLFRNCSHRLW